MRLGFIGLGIMGTPMAVNLAHTGHQPYVTTIGPVVDELLLLGTTSVEAVRQITDTSDITLVMVPDIPWVEDVLSGENGCTEVSLKGKTVADISSISLIEIRRSARQVSGLGGDRLDVPVSGGEIGACEGTLSIMVGGDETIFERIKPLFELPGKNTILMGGNGDGQTCKVVNQTAMALNVGVVSEVLLPALKAGADLVYTCQALMGGFASLRTLEVHGERMIKRTLNPGLKIALHQKDLNLVL